MTEDPVCVIPDQNIDEATKLMEDRQISRLLVVDENQRPIRMVGLQDLSQVDMGKSAEALSEIKRQ
jgi:CBS domain-containing protein